MTLFSCKILLIHEPEAVEFERASPLAFVSSSRGKMKGANRTVAGQTIVQKRKAADSPLRSGRPVIEFDYKTLFAPTRAIVPSALSLLLLSRPCPSL